MQANKTKAAEYGKKSAQVISKNHRYEKSLAKNTAKKAKYDRKLYKEGMRRRPDEDKLAKYAAKSAKANAKIMKAQSKTTHNKYAVKAEKFKAEAEVAKLKIEKNDRLQRTYKTTIKALNEGSVKKGALFMQYKFAEQDVRHA